MDCLLEISAVEIGSVLLVVGKLRRVTNNIAEDWTCGCDLIDVKARIDLEKCIVDQSKNFAVVPAVE